MSERFTSATRALFDKRVLAHVASLRGDGAPHVSPMWVELDGEEIVINTVLGRATARNLAADARVALSLTDPDDPDVRVVVRGTVVTFTTEGAEELLDRFAQKYLGQDTFADRREGEVRVNVRIRPEHIASQPA